MDNYILRQEIGAHFYAKKLYIEWRIACRKARAARLDVEAAEMEREREELEKQQQEALNRVNNTPDTEVF